MFAILLALCEGYPTEIKMLLFSLLSLWTRYWKKKQSKLPLVSWIAATLWLNCFDGCAGWLFYPVSTVSNCSLCVIPYGLAHHSTQITKFMGPTWGLYGPCQPQMGPMLAPWTLLSGIIKHSLTLAKGHIRQSLTAPICDRSCASCHVQRFVTTSVSFFFLKSKSNFHRIWYVMKELMVKQTFKCDAKDL